MKALGGLLFGIAMVVIVVRRGYSIDPWGEFAIFATLFVPTVLLYGGGVLGARARARASAGPTGWQIVFAGAGILLLPVTLFAFLDWIGGNPSSSWNSLWIFGLVTVAALAAAAGGVRIGYLLGGIAALIAWFALWDEILSGGIEAHFTTTRWLFLIAALFLLFVGAVLSGPAQRAGGSGDLLTVAGLAAIAAGALSLASLSTPAVQVTDLGQPITSEALGGSTFWELELLVVSLLLVVYGVGTSFRGPVYVGALGIAAFIPVAAIDFKNLDGSLWGWPVVLLVVSVLMLAAGFRPGPKRSGA